MLRSRVEQDYSRYQEEALLEDVALLVAKEKYEAEMPKDRLLTIDEWLADPDYSGEFSECLYPFWRNQLRDVFKGGKLTSYNGIVVTGSLSSGKSYFTEALWARMLYEFSRIKNLQGYLGMSPSTKILFAYLSLSVQIAKDTAFGQLTTILDNTPYFNQVYVRDKDRDSMLIYPNLVYVKPGSDMSHFTGMNMIACTYDEANFAKTGGGNTGDTKKAEATFSSAQNRIVTRFDSAASQFAGLNVLVSSNTHKESFTETTIRGLQGSLKVKLIPTRLFDTKPEGTYLPQRFLFYLGDPINGPKIMDRKEDLTPLLSLPAYESLNGNTPQEWHDSLPLVNQLEYCMVPENFRDLCTRNPDLALQDVIGHSLALRGRFFSNSLDYNFCTEQGRMMGLIHPFTQSTFTISMKGDQEIIQFLSREYLKRLIGKNPCYIHLDAAEVECNAGITLSYILKVPGALPRIVVPLMIRIVPPGGQDRISIEKMRNFVEDLAKLGLHIQKVTFDQFNAHIFRSLELKNFKAELFSVQRSDVPWLKVSDLFFTHTICLYDYEPFKAEWFSVIHNRQTAKIEKDKNGFKDVADTLVGSVFNAWKDMDEQGVSSSKGDVIGEVLSHWSKQNLSDKDKIMQNFFGNVRPLGGW